MFEITSAPIVKLSEINHDNGRELIRILDILGRETKPKRSTPLFYIYDDGTVEKKIIIK